MAILLGAASSARSVSAASYFLISDSDLLARSPVVVLARAGAARVVAVAGFGTETRTTFQLERMVKGAAPSTFELALPGGRAPNGAQSFYWLAQPSLDAEYVLFLRPRADGAYAPVEYELGIFRVLAGDAASNPVALRLPFYLRTAAAFPAPEAPAVEQPRDLSRFLDWITASADARPGTLVAADYFVSSNDVVRAQAQSAMQPYWTGLSTTTLYRWNNGATAVVTYYDDDPSTSTNPVSGVSGGGASQIQASAAHWTSDSSSSIAYSYGGAGPSEGGSLVPSGRVYVHVDDTVQFGGTGIPCSLGTIGLGGVSAVSGSHTFKGETYFTIASGIAYMRRWDCTSSSYLASAFENGVTHELGHTLGLGHPDESTSPHDTTPNDVSGAVMISVGNYNRPTGLGSDDIEGVCYLYGSCTGGSTAPAAAFSYSPGSPKTGQSVQFVDASAGGPTSWSWNFGDSGSGSANTSTLQNPIHAFSSSGSHTVQLTVSNGSGGGSTQKTVSVSDSVAPPSANFTYSPSAPLSGQSVQFTDTSAGSPTSWSWSFGDGSGSASRHPSHAFSAPGSYVVTLSVSNGSGQSQASKALGVLAPPPSARSVTIPGAAHVIGGGGMLFRTDLAIENPLGVTVAAKLVFAPAGGGSERTVALTIGPHETRLYKDVVASVFGVGEGLGALRLDTEGSPPSNLRMTSRTYNSAAGGTQGLGVPGFANDSLQAGSRYVTGIAVNADFRTNLGAVNTTESAETFQIVLRGTSGAIVGATPFLTLPPGGQQQWSVPSLFGSVSGSGLTAEFLPQPGSSAPFAYAALVDEHSGDSTYYPSIVPASQLLLPGLAEVAGAGSSRFRTELTIHNASGSTRSFQLTFLEQGRDNVGAPSITLAIGPRSARHFDDALAQLFGRRDTFGALMIQAPSPAIVAGERIFTASPAGAGTVGQQVDPLIDSGAPVSGSLLGLRDDPEFRTNVVLLNRSTSYRTVRLTLLRPSGSVFASAQATVAPLGYTLQRLSALFPAIAGVSPETWTLAVESPDASVYAASTVIDNMSQDPTYAAELP